MHGQRLGKGDLVIPLIGAANRDPSKFSDPDTVDIARNEGNHLSFGYGPHVCIGAMLTYMEAEIAFTSLIKRFPNIHLASETPKWSSNTVYRGLVSLPVFFGSAEIGSRVIARNIPCTTTVSAA
jgi:cytochrome P450